MATHRMPILGPGTVPDTSGECWQEPYTILATNDVWKHLAFRFGASNAAQPAVRHGIYGVFVVPKNFVGSPVIVPYWSTSLITGNVVWDFEYRAVGGDDLESLDQAGTQESITITDAAASAAHELLQPTGLALTAANLAVDDIVEFYFARDGVDAADTMAGAAMLHTLLFQYTD